MQVRLWSTCGLLPPTPIFSARRPEQRVGTKTPIPPPGPTRTGSDHWPHSRGAAARNVFVQRLSALRATCLYSACWIASLFSRETAASAIQTCRDIQNCQCHQGTSLRDFSWSAAIARLRPRTNSTSRRRVGRTSSRRVRGRTRRAFVRGRTRRAVVRGRTRRAFVRVERLRRRVGRLRTPSRPRRLPARCTGPSFARRAAREGRWRQKSHASNSGHPANLRT